MSNLDLWNSIRTVPPEAQKKITGGRLSGMTDISPMWRYLELTKHFGPCGIGWKYTIDHLWVEHGEGHHVCAFAAITMYVRHKGEWSDGIPGIGGSMLVNVEKNGPHTSDEAYKMAVTDALSVACKVLGMGADVYWFAGSKYSAVADEPQKTVEKAPNQTKATSSPKAPQAKVDELVNACYAAADGDAELAEKVIELASTFIKDGRTRKMTLKDAAAQSEKYIDYTLKMLSEKSVEIDAMLVFNRDSLPM